MNRKVVKVIILMMMIVVSFIGCYAYLSSRNAGVTSDQSVENNVDEESTPVQELLAKAKYKEYPTTPVQVVKYYNEITSCFYNETYSDEELEELAHLAWDLLDSDLAANMTWDQYMSQLQDDIFTFKSGHITIYKSELTPATDVEYFEQDGYSCARLYCIYTLKSGTKYVTSREVFILRKDEEGHWKIFGFALANEDE